MATNVDSSGQEMKIQKSSFGCRESFDLKREIRYMKPEILTFNCVGYVVVGDNIRIG